MVGVRGRRVGAWTRYIYQNENLRQTTSNDNHLSLMVSVGSQEIIIIKKKNISPRLHL